MKQISSAATTGAPIAATESPRKVIVPFSSIRAT
jgi:hypothetical protein